MSPKSTSGSATRWACSSPRSCPDASSAYDGSSVGTGEVDITLHLKTRRGLAYLLTAPGDLGLARAYVMGDLDIDGVHPGDPYDALVLLYRNLKFRAPTPAEALQIVRGLGWSNLKPPPVPPQETLPRWRRTVEGLRHSMGRDAEAIHHHYDVSNRFYEMVLGPSMTYTCAVFPHEDATLEEAQDYKYDLVARKLDLKPGMRLLDVGCGWGGMVRFAAREYGVKALGATLSVAAGVVGQGRPSTARGWPTWPRCATPTTATCSRATSTRSARSG